MEVKKTLLTIYLVMGVTFAYKTLGVLNDETILDELDSFKTNEEDAEDLPELRRKLSHDATSITMEDEFSEFCRVKKEPFKVIHGGRSYQPSDPKFQIICEPPDDNVVYVDDKPHQVCNSAQRIYCFQKEEYKAVFYRDRGRTKSKNMYLKTGCLCGLENVRKR